MNNTNRLGLIVACITITIFIIGYVGYVAVKKLIPSNTVSQTEKAAPSAQPTAIPEQDTDQDGLPDLVENLYQTDPNNPDTDGDGTKDGDEVALGRNPAKAGPDDVLDDLQTGIVTLPTDTYTKKYLANLPSNLPREKVVDKERLEAFIEQEKGTLLPEVSIKTTNASGKEAIEKYLDLISADNPDITAISSTDIEKAYRDYYSNPKTSTDLSDILTSLKKNVTTLQAVEAPLEVKELHQKLVAASQALANNTELLTKVTDDFVGSLIGAKNIELLGPVFASISDQVSALEKKYKLN